jgi:hypothetical protein
VVAGVPDAQMVAVEACLWRRRRRLMTYSF